MKITQILKWKDKEYKLIWHDADDFSKLLDKNLTQSYGVCLYKGKLLIVKNNGNWSLPGGHLEKGEKPEEALKALHTASQENLDMKVFAKLSMMRLRYVLMKSISEVEARILADDLSASDIEALNELSKLVSPQQVAGALKKLLEVYQSIGKTYIQSLPLELLLAELV